MSSTAQQRFERGKSEDEREGLVLEPVLLRLPQASAEPPRPDLNLIHGRRALDAGDRILLGRIDLRISLLGSSS